MKNLMKYAAAVIIVILPLLLAAQSGTYTVNGKIGKLSSPAKAYIMYNNGRHIDSAIINNGIFRFTDTITQTRRAYLIINEAGTGPKAGDKIIFYLEPATINIVSLNSISSAKITGGPANTDAARLQLALLPVNKKIDSLNEVYKKAPVKERESKEFIEVFQKRGRALENEQKSVALAFAKSHPNSLVSLFALQEYEGFTPDVTEIEPAFNALSADVRATPAGVNYAKRIARMKKTVLGVMAPDFTQPDTSGKAVSLNDFKGKYVLIDFWASWCGPCRAENPNVLAAFNAYKDKNFTVLSVSLDDTASRGEWIKAIYDDHLAWTNVSDLKGGYNVSAQVYDVLRIPQNFLIDSEGKIIAKNMRGDELINKLKEFLSK